MKISQRLCAQFAFILFAVFTDPILHSVMADEPTWISGANNAFAFEMYGKLAAGGEGNLFFSPHSIETALAMT